MEEKQALQIVLNLILSKRFKFDGDELPVLSEVVNILTNKLNNND